MNRVLIGVLIAGFLLVVFILWHGVSVENLQKTENLSTATTTTTTEVVTVTKIITATETVAITPPDSDGDGISDELELKYGTNPYKPNLLLVYALKNCQKERR